MKGQHSKSHEVAFYSIELGSITGEVFFGLDPREIRILYRKQWRMYEFVFLETSLKTHDKVGRTRSWSLLQISHKSHKHENEDKNEAPNLSLPSSSLFLILGSKGLCCFVEVLYRAIINTCLFNGVKPSEVKVKRTNKRLRSKRIKRICRFVDSVSVCIHMHTELLLNLGSCSVVTELEGLSSLLVCFTLIICHTDISSFCRHFFIISRNILRCAPGLCSL